VITPPHELNPLRFSLWKAGVRIDPFPVVHPHLKHARTLDQVQKGLDQGLEEVLIDSAAVVRLGADADVDTARHFADGILLAAPRFPQVWLSAVTAVPMQYSEQGLPFAATTHTHWKARDFRFVLTHSRISVAAEWLSQEPGTRRFWEGGGQALARLDPGRPPGTSTPTGIGVHEFIHAVEAQLAHPEWKYAGVIPGYPNSLRDDVARMVGDRLGIPAARVTEHQVGQVLGFYAATNLGELTAEAGADVILNGPRANPINQSIFGRMKTAILPFEPGPGAELQVWLGRHQTQAIEGIHEYAKRHTFPPPAPVPAAASPRYEQARAIARIAAHGLPEVRTAVDHLRTTAMKASNGAAAEHRGSVNQQLPEIIHGPGVPANINQPLLRRSRSHGPAR
jgi:hypothetical protein